MVSSNEAGLDLREIYPLPRNILQDRGAHGFTGQQVSPRTPLRSKGYQSWLMPSTSPKVSAGDLSYPAGTWDSAKSGLGHTDNRHLNYLVESISVNVGGPCQGAKPSSPAIPDTGVGAAIVVGARESRAHGEGPQSVGSPT